MKLFIIYWIFAVLFETIYLYFGWQRAKKQLLANTGIQMFVSIAKQNANYQSLKRKIWNPYTIIFVAIPLGIIVSPFLLPLSLFSLVKKIIGYKTKLEKAAEEERKRFEESEKKHKEWMEKEGDINPFDFTKEEKPIDVDIKK